MKNVHTIKTAYCQGFKCLMSLSKSGKIGEIKSVGAAFIKLVPCHVREMRFENQGDTEKYIYKFARDGLRYEMVGFLERIGGM